MELPKSSFEQFIDQVKDKKGVKMDNELDADDMSELIVLFKDHYKKSLGEFPGDPRRKQLMGLSRNVPLIGRKSAMQTPARTASAQLGTAAKHDPW